MYDDPILKSHLRALEEREFAGVFKLLRKAFGPKRRMILSKALPAAMVKKAKPTALKMPVRKPVIVRKPTLSDRELAVFLGDATVRGLLTGSLALQAQNAVDSGGKMPAEVRAILRTAYSGKSGK